MQTLSQKSRDRSAAAHSVMLLVAIFLFLGSLVLSIQTPSVDFSLNTQVLSGQGGLVVQSSSEQEGGVRVGDHIEAVNGKIVRSRAEFWFQLLFADGASAEITVKRYGTLFQRQLTAASFAQGGLPLGLRRGDRPIRMQVGQRDLVALEDMDIESLKPWVEAECQESGCLVTFRRSEDLQSVGITLRRNVVSVVMVLASLLFVFLIGSVWVMHRRGVRRDWEKSTYLLLNLSLLMGYGGVLHLGMSGWLLSMPPLFLLTLIALGLFKVFHLDLHLRLRLWGVKEQAIRVALYVGPIATLVFPTFLLFRSMGILWGGGVSLETEMRIETMRLLIVLWFLLYTTIDVALFLWQQFFRKKSQAGKVPRLSDITLIIGWFLALIAFILLYSDFSRATWFLMASIILQVVGDYLGSLQRGRGMEYAQSEGILSASVVRDLLERAQGIVGDKYYVYILVDRPKDKQCVALSLDEEGSSLTGLMLISLDRVWKDFLDIFRVEGGVYPHQEVVGEDSEPVSGMAQELGIALAWPIMDGAAGSLTSVSLVLVYDNMISAPPAPSVAQKAALGLMKPDFARACTTFAYLSAELALIEQEQSGAGELSTSQFLRTAQMLAASSVMPAQALPHGLIDDDELEAVGQGPHEEAEADLTYNPNEAETKILEDHVQQLHSQVVALQNQQLRSYALSEIELTQDQAECLDDIIALGVPILVLGESGVGKQLISLAAHGALGGGSFLSIDVAQVPLSVLGLELFGEGEDGGLIKAALGGSLFINNVDRLPISFINDIMDAAESIQSEQAIRLFFAINTKFDEIACEGVQRCNLQIPDAYKEIAENCDAEIVFVSPLRQQHNALQVAEFFMYKEAVRCEKTITQFHDEALQALKAYSWPGNFEELHSVIARAVLRCKGKVLQVADLGRDFEELSPRSSEVTMTFEESGRLKEQMQFMQALNETQQNQIEQLQARIMELEVAPKLSLVEEDDAQEASLLEGNYQEIEHRLLERLLQKYGNDKELALKHLELSRTIFLNKLGKHGLN